MSFVSNIFSSSQTNPGSSAGVVGIDIGTSSIKVVELQDRKGVITLVTYGEVQLGPYVEKSIGQSVKLDAKQEQTALIDVIRESAVKAKSAVFSTPLSASFVTNVSIEADADDDLAAMVRVEARKVIPASLSDVTLDWAEVEITKAESDKKEGSYRNVLIAAIQNAALERYRVLMQFVGLSKPPTEIECFSTIRGLYSVDEEDMAIIDIGSVTSKLYIVRKGLLMRMYRIRAGGAIATKQIAEAFKVDFDEAESIKCEADKKRPNYTELKKVHNSSYGRAFREFAQVIREYEKRTGIVINSVYLTGGGSMFQGLDVQLREVLSKDVVVSSPFSKVAYPAFMEDTMKKIGPSFGVAIGAAMRSFE